MTRRPRVAVVGGGITGLAAAWELGRGGADVVVFEAAPRAGGKLQASEVPPLPHPIEEAADAFLARVPDALDACRELGLDDLVHPATGDAWIYARGALRPLPKGQLLGLPTDLDEVARSGLLSPEGLARAEEDLRSDAPPIDDDVSVGRLVRGRLGDEVCEHLVEPLLGGINAGEADGLSVAATAAQIWECARRGGSLVAAARAMKASSPAGHVFAAPRGGMTALVDAFVRRSGAEIRLATPAAPLRTAAPGRVLLGDERFDAAVVATPSHHAGSYVRGVAPDAADVLDSIPFASVAMVTLTFPLSSVPHPMAGSGFVVARSAGLRITGCSWAHAKWAHVGDGDHAVLRVSLGHDADPVEWCRVADEGLVRAAREDLAAVMGIEAPPSGMRVGRWSRAFPQYRPGHLDRIASVRAATAPLGLQVAGASMEGLGVPACIRQGRAAARQLLDPA